MASQVPPKKNAAHTFFLALGSQSSAYTFQTNPTLATGDVKVSTDGAAFANIATLPVVTPSGGKAVKVDLSASEMNGDNIQVLFSDAAGAEWADVLINIQTSARQLDDLAYPATSGRSLAVDTSGQVTTGALANNAITAAAIAADAITAAKIADGAIDAATFAAGAIDAAAIATDAIGSAELAASAVSEIQSGLMLAASYSAPPSAATIAAAVWDYLASAATTVGSLGKRIADNLDAAVNSRLASAAYTAPDNSTISAIAAKTTNLPSDPADASDIAAAFAAVPGAVRTNLATELGRIDVAISTRLAGAGYTAPPSAADNATAVRSELTTELGCLDAAMTSRATPAQVNAEVVDALSVDTYAEPGAVPAATSSLKDKIGWLFMLARNKRNTTGSADAVRNDADSATVATAALSDSGTTFSRGKYS